MADRVTVKNIGDSPVTVGPTFLFPGESRVVPLNQWRAVEHNPAIALAGGSIPSGVEGGIPSGVEGQAEPEPARPQDVAEPGETMPEIVTESGKLAGMLFVIAGNLPGWTRAEAERFIADHGGEVQPAITGNTSALLVGENPGRKLEQAHQTGVLVIGKTELLHMAGVDDA